MTLSSRNSGFVLIALFLAGFAGPRFLLAGAVQDYSGFQGGRSFTEAIPLRRGNLQIDPFRAVNIDWNQKAPHELLERAGRLAGFDELHFEAPVDDKLRGLHFYIFDPNGVGKIRLTRLEGTIRRDAVYGKIEGVPEVGDIMPGVVLVSKEPIDFEIIPLSKEAPGITFPKVEMKASESHLSGIQTLYEVRVKQTEERFIFVQWEADVECRLGCCTTNFDFYRKGEKLEHLVWLRYGCDV